MKRRTFLIAGTAGLATVATGTTRRAWAADRLFTFVSWGGALSKAEQDAFIDPFAKMKGIKAINTSPTNTAKIKAMVDAKSVEWDLVDVGGRTVWQGAAGKFLEPLDMSKIPNAKALDPKWVAPTGIATSTGATIIAWSKSAFPDGGPQSWADFWDVKRFPGARGLYKYFYYNYEAALLADGMKPDEIYPVTEEKVKAAFAKIKELKPHVTVWWGSGAQPPQLLSSGELAMSSAWSGRILAAVAEDAPVDYTYKDGIAWANWWVIPKGSPYVELALEAMNFALAPAQQEKLLVLKTYGPILSSVADAADPATKKILVMTPENIKHMLIINEREAGTYMTKYSEQWDQLML